MTDQPIWLLDFDGVVNVLAPRGDESAWTDWNIHGESAHPDSLPWFLWSSTVASLVREARDAGVCVMWLTSWEASMRNAEKVVTELPEGLDILTRADNHTNSRYWKAGAARSVIREGVPVLWTDDDLSKILRPKDDKEWAQRMDTTRIAPNPAVGLTPKHVAQIRSWIKRVTK